jgi:N-acetylneuraminic acid mutarotase
VANVDAVFIYSIAEKRWTRGAPLPFASRGLAACIFDDRHILIAGGYTDRFSADCFIYDTKADRYSNTLSLPYTAMVNLVRAGDFVYCVGGEDKMKHRSPNCYRIPWRELLLPGS